MPSALNLMKMQNGKSKMDEQKRDKNIEAIAKIIELTRNNKIVWKSVNSEKVPSSSEEIISYVFTSKYNEKILRIYDRSYLKTVYQDLTFSDILKNNERKSERKRLSEVVLEITNISGESLWKFPPNPILKDLLKSIKFKVSGADDLINSLLNE